MYQSRAVPVALSLFAVFTTCQAAGSDRIVASEPTQAKQSVFLDLDGAGDLPMPGGFAPGDPAEPGAKVAYSMVENAIYQRVEPGVLVDRVTLETQVVAGLNYRFQVEMTGAPDGGATFIAVVYRSLDDAFELVSLARTGQ